MKLQEFLDRVQQLLRTTDDEFKFENPGEMSAFLYGFRTHLRHPGDFEDIGVWAMIRTDGKPPIEMKITRESTIVSRESLLEISNILVAEANDMLLCKYGPNARLHEYVCVENLTSQDRTGGFKRRGNAKVKTKEIGISLTVLVASVVVALFGYPVFAGMLCGSIVYWWLLKVLRFRNGCYGR